jgi:amphi-Trp domain-containing protein
MGTKKEIEIKTWLTRDEMVNYLHDLANCLAQGRVVLQRGNEYLELIPAQSMELEMEGVHKKGQQKISLELTWRQVVLEPVDDPLRIASEPLLPSPPAEALPEPSAEEQAVNVMPEAGPDYSGENQAAPEAEDEAGSEEKPRRGKAVRR